MKKRAFFLVWLCGLTVYFSDPAMASASGGIAAHFSKATDSLGIQAAARRPHSSSYADHRPLYERELDSIEKAVPLDYNESVNAHIEQYVYRRKGHISRMMGLGEYYFPIFEQALKEKGLPLELKFLSVVESALNPMAVSRVGATGLWQFMYTTAKEYDLQINSYIDERRDPVAASRAAAQYLSNMYSRYGDWLLAIASYNCGAGNVDRAIYKAGGKLDFWAIRPYLPRETRNYVPAYIAVTYMMNYADKYHIRPAEASLAFEPVPVLIERHTSLSRLSRELDMEIDQLYLMNPKYRRRIVNGSGARPQTLWLPPLKAELYAQLQRADAEPRLITASGSEAGAAPAKSAAMDEKAGPEFYRVQSGDNLIAIANRFDCTVQDIKVWNKLTGNRIVPGQRLQVSSGVTENDDVGKGKAYLVKTYKVQRGDTLLSIAARFGTSVEKLKELNDIQSATALREGKIIKLNPEG